LRGAGSWACQCARRVIVSGRKVQTISCPKHVGVEQGQASHRHQGVQQEDRLFRQPADESDVYMMLASLHTYLLARTRPASLHAVAALDDIGLERDGAWPAVQLQKQTAGVAENGARLIASPQGRSACCAVLTYRLDACQRLVLDGRRCYRLDKSKNWRPRHRHMPDHQPRRIGRKRTGAPGCPPEVAGAAVA
jgi:hypothetical protein